MTARTLTATIVFASFALAPALAQDAVPGANYAAASPFDSPKAVQSPLDGAATPQPAEPSLGSALMFDPATLVDKAPPKTLRTPRLTDGVKDIDGKRDDKPDGSSAYSFNKPLLTEWDAKIGADLNTPAAQQDSTQPMKPMIGPQSARNETGAAWANVGIPNVGSLDARVDPTQDQGRVGATLGRKLPVSRDLAVTLQDTVSVNDTFGTPANTTPGLPVGSVPAPQRVWGNEKTVKFDVLPTGTTLAAGVTNLTNDPVTHNKLSAEQKLYGPLRVTTSVTDVGQTTAAKSITAGFKLNW